MSANETFPVLTGTEAVFRGASGRAYQFSVHRPDDAFAETAVVYAFARPGFEGRGWVVVFLSRTGNLAQRLRSHELWGQARLLGATHVLIHRREARDVREYVEADLLESLRPALNAPLLDAEVCDDAADADQPVDRSAAAPPLRLVWAA